MCPSKKKLGITMLSNGRAPLYLDGHHYVSVWVVFLMIVFFGGGFLAIVGGDFLVVVFLAVFFSGGGDFLVVVFLAVVSSGGGF
jgi:hypothetical protein